MSRFAGWVRMPRRYIGDLLDGRLSGNEHYALSQLILLADSSTGGDRINAPMLRYYCGGVFNVDTAQRILKRLHDGGYIWYRGVRYSKQPQPYWINDYVLTTGRMRSRITRLSQLTEKQTISQEEVWRLASQLKDEVADETTDDDADNYKKEKDTDKKKNPLSIPIPRMSHSLSDSKSAAQSASVSTKGEVMCARDSTVCAQGSPPPTHTSNGSPSFWGEPVEGYLFIEGEGGGYRHIGSGQLITSLMDMWFLRRQP